MRLTYKQRLLIFFLVITVSILTLFIITYNANVENNNDRHWIQHSYDVILTLTRTRSNLKDNVLACNRFLATKEVSLLPLIGAQKEVAITGFGQLTELTADNPQQQEL